MMETAVKERLVGAAVLVVLVVLVVPALLSGPPRPALPDAAGDGTTRSVEIDIARPRANGGGIPVSPAAPGEAMPVPSTLPDSTPSASAAAESPAGPAQAVTGAGGSTATANAQAAAPAWAVQVAALSSADSAGRLVADLRRRGYPAFILEYRSAGKVLYRVRVGPEAERERAAALAKRLQGDGLKATLVAHP